MNKKAVVFMLFGQSNAVGHALPMKETDIINKPLKNVFGLGRERNQSFDISSLSWEGYLSGGMNLAEEQDNTYSIANCLAQLWQNAIDGGEKLPDLYILQIAIGAQGVSEGFMWYPEREKRLIPGVLGRVDISLHPFARHILSLLPNSMQERGVRPQYLLHWRGGEEDFDIPKEKLIGKLQPIYEKMFSEYCDALGELIPIRLHLLICEKRAMNMNPEGAFLESLHYVNEVFEGLCEKQSNISIFNPCHYPEFSLDKEHYGVFLPDEVHFTREFNEWAAAQIINEIKSSRSEYNGK